MTFLVTTNHVLQVVNGVVQMAAWVLSRQWEPAVKRARRALERYLRR